MQIPLQVADITYSLCTYTRKYFSEKKDDWAVIPTVEVLDYKHFHNEEWLLFSIEIQKRRNIAMKKARRLDPSGGAEDIPLDVETHVALFSQRMTYRG